MHKIEVEWLGILVNIWML